MYVITCNLINRLTQTFRLMAFREKKVVKYFFNILLLQLKNHYFQQIPSCCHGSEEISCQHHNFSDFSSPAIDKGGTIYVVLGFLLMSIEKNSIQSISMHFNLFIAHLEKIQTMRIFSSDFESELFIPIEFRLKSYA